MLFCQINYQTTINTLQKESDTCNLSPTISTYAKTYNKSIMNKIDDFNC